MTDDRAARICYGCGAVAAGMSPEGWAIEQIRQAFPGIGRVVVGERAYCPECQAAAQRVIAAR